MAPLVTMSRHPRIVLLTADQRRHRAAASQLARALDLRGIVSEAKANPLPAPEGVPPEDRVVLERHIAERDATERRLLGDPLFPSAPLLEVPRRGVNGPEVLAWVRERAPDILVLYGTSLIREPLLQAFAGRVVNIHLGLSPYYRGSGTNFWPLVNGEPECVGATIHLAVADVDAGPILGQLRPRVTVGDRAHDMGTHTIVDAMAALSPLLAEWFGGRVAPQPQRHSGGRAYRRADVDAEAVRRMERNIAAGMIDDFARNHAVRCAAVPIVELPAGLEIGASGNREGAHA